LVDGCGLPQPTREFGVDSGTKKQIAGGKSRFKNAEHAFEVPKEQVKPEGMECAARRSGIRSPSLNNGTKSAGGKLRGD
jgi:hypothetical protein